MTREEAKAWFKVLLKDEYAFNSADREAFAMAIKALEQEPILDRDCEHCSKTYGTLGCCTTVSNKWVYSCKEGQREYLLDKIRTEIEPKCDRINSLASTLRYPAHREIQELLCEIMDLFEPQERSDKG